MINTSSIFSQLSSAEQTQLEQAYEVEPDNGLFHQFYNSFDRLKDALGGFQGDPSNSQAEARLGSDQVWAYVEDPFSLLHSTQASVVAHAEQNPELFNPIPRPTIGVQDAILTVLTVGYKAQIQKLDMASKDIQFSQFQLDERVQRLREFRQELLQKQREAKRNREHENDTGNKILGFFTAPFEAVAYFAVAFASIHAYLVSFQEGVLSTSYNFLVKSWDKLKSSLPILNFIESAVKASIALFQGKIKEFVADLAQAGYFLVESAVDFYRISRLQNNIIGFAVSNTVGIDLKSPIEKVTDEYFKFALGVIGSADTEAALHTYEHNKNLIGDQKIHAIFSEYYGKQIEEEEKRVDAYKTSIRTQIEQSKKDIEYALTNLQNLDEYGFNLIDRLYSTLQQSLNRLAA